MHIKEDLNSFWTIAGVQADWVEAVTACDPFFINGKLWVAQEVQAMEDPLGQVSKVF